MEPTTPIPQASQTYTFKRVDVPFEVARDTQAYGISPQGWLVGEYTDGPHPEETLRSELLSFRQKPGVTTMLPAILVRGINQDGWLTGHYRSVFTGDYRAFMSTGQQFLALDVPDAVESQGWGINNTPWIVGTYRRIDRMGGRFHAFLYRHEIREYADFEPPWDHGHAALLGVNNLGCLVGTYDHHGFGVDATGTFHQIDVPGAAQTRPHGVNDRNVVVGTYEDESETIHGFILTAGVYQALDVPFAGAVETHVRGINHKGVIVGYYWHEPSATFHGFTATPR